MIFENFFLFRETPVFTWALLLLFVFFIGWDKEVAVEE